MKTCSVQECKEKHYARGLCHKHWAREYYRNNPSVRYNNLLDERHIKSCSIGGCKNRLYAKGFCRMHYGRYLHHGNTDLQTRIISRHEIIGDYLYIYANNTGNRFKFDKRMMYLTEPPYGVWNEDKDGYLITGVGGGNIRVHSIVKPNCPKGFEVDHKDGNTYNNIDDNLQFITHKDNIRKSKIFITNTSGYRGVSRGTNRVKPWMAYITVDYKHLFLGSFANPIDAARAYDEAAGKYFGQYAMTNQKMGLLPKE